jgi:hypothetical protein
MDCVICQGSDCYLDLPSDIVGNLKGYLNPCVGSQLRLLGMTFCQNPFPRVLKSAVTDTIKRTEEDVLWKITNKTSYIAESVGRDY